MENEEISEKISALYALSDVMNYICTYLSMKDLCHVSQICKTWNEVATREKAKRCYIRRLLIPYNMDNKEISSAMYGKPYVTLLFFNRRIYTRSMYTRRRINGIRASFRDIFGCYYRKLFPNNAIALVVEEYFMNKDASFNSLYDVNLKTKDNEHNILSLLFPMKCGLDVKVCWGNYGSRENLSDRIIETLEINELQKQNSAFLIFAKGSVGRDIAAVINDAIRRRFQKTKHTLWAANDHAVLVANRQSRRYDELSDINFVALRISSSSFESWTLTLDCSVRTEELNCSLYEFRNKIQLKRFTFGLVYLPSAMLITKKFHITAM